MPPYLFASPVIIRDPLVYICPDQTAAEGECAGAGDDRRLGSLFAAFIDKISILGIVYRRQAVLVIVHAEQRMAAEDSPCHRVCNSVA
ncbi:hypothetical protein D3C87_1734960 [compost metagenome]